MSVVFEPPPSDSPYVARVWRSQSECVSTFTSMAATQWELAMRLVKSKPFASGVVVHIYAPEKSA